MRILLDNDYIITDELIRKDQEILVVGPSRIQIKLKEQTEVHCFNYGEMVSLTIEVIQEAIKKRILIFDVQFPTRFKLQLSFLTIRGLYSIQVELTEKELEEIFNQFNQQKVVIHDPVKLETYYKTHQQNLAAYVAKQLKELYPI